MEDRRGGNIRLADEWKIGADEIFVWPTNRRSARMKYSFGRRIEDRRGGNIRLAGE